MRFENLWISEIENLKRFNTSIFQEKTTFALKLCFKFETYKKIHLQNTLTLQKYKTYLIQPYLKFQHAVENYRVEMSCTVKLLYI